MKILIAFLISLLPLISLADEEIDLSDVGGSDFTPYIVDREPLWVLLPIAMLAFVLLHLKKRKRVMPAQEGDQP